MNALPFIVLMVLAGSATTALAQTSGNAARSPAQPARTPLVLDTVHILGSHIRRTEIETQHPLLVLDREALLRSGLNTVGDVLQWLPGNGDSLGRGYNNEAGGGAGKGQVRLNLRGLGANRTLVLVDGQRWLPALDGAADLSTIPLALVERIEVLRDGASAIYGADAIGGVVNIATRRDYDGSEAGAYFGRNEHGDGLRRAFDFTYGRSGERWNAAIGLEYGNDSQVVAADREISAVTAGYGLPPYATAFVNPPYGMLLTQSRRPPNYLTLIPGRPGTSSADFRPFDPGRDGFNSAPWWLLLTPQERRGAFAQLRFELTPALGFTAQLLHDERRSAHLRPAPRLQFSASSPGPAGQIRISRDSLYNPFGEDVPFLLRQLVEAGPRHFEYASDATRLRLALDGVFPLAQRDFSWNLDAVWSRAEHGQREGPFAINDRLQRALGPSFRDAGGIARCGTPAAPIAGCVPLNLLGGPGSVTPEMLAYVTEPWARRRGRGELWQLDLRMSGDIVDLPAGPLAIAAGIEHRREQAFDEPNALIVAGQANGFISSDDRPTRGRYSVREAYLEFDAPLLRDKPFARSLDFNVAARQSDYSSFGNHLSLQAGLRWKPNDSLLLRANIAEGFRAPSISELYRGQLNSRDFIDDPCAVANRPSPTLAARCTELGAPPATVLARPQVNRQFGGNPDLQPETALNRNLGVVYAPRWFTGLELSLDWYRIQVRDAIGMRPAEVIVNNCYLLADASACARITRDASGNLQQVSFIDENLRGGIETEGYDLGLRWQSDTRLGQIGVRWDATYTSYYGELGQPRRLSPRADGSPAAGNLVGTAGGANFTLYWRLRSTATLSWQRERWDATLGLRYFSHLDEDCLRVIGIAALVGDPSLRQLCSDPDRMVAMDAHGFAVAAPRNRLGGTTYLDLEAGWSTPWQSRIAIGMRNASDRDPPPTYSAPNSPYYAGYDVPGRFWYLRYRQSW